MPLDDTADLTLFYAPQSRAFMGLWLMEELDQPYRIERFNLKTGDHKSKRLTAHNPMGKVPTVRDGSVDVSETGAIITYLVDKHASGRLGPPVDSPERGPYLKWLFFGGSVIEPSFGEKFFKWDVPARSVGWGSFADMMATVTAAVTARPFLVGDAFTGADLYIASTLRYGSMFGIVDKQGPVADYIARCTDRDAFRSATAMEEGFVKQAA